MGRIEVGDPPHTEVTIGRGRPRPMLPDAEGRRLVAILAQPTVAAIARSVAAELGTMATVRILPD
ncbi:MAG: hypothetical protein KJO18_01940, partial [Acidimicrobiia bacterium]|nr:hypothetical protein [Acidimicrobiia bacterium]